MPIRPGSSPPREARRVGTDGAGIAPPGPAPRGRLSRRATDMCLQRDGGLMAKHAPRRPNGWGLAAQARLGHHWS